MRFDFGQYITETSAAKTQAELLAVTDRYLKSVGVDRFLISLLNAHPLHGLPAMHGVAHSYPDDWMCYYFEKQYRKIDPVCLRCHGLGAFTWQSLMELPGHTRLSRRMMREADDAGLVNGIGIGVATGGRQRVGIGMSADRTARLHPDLLTMLNHVGIQLVSRFVDITKTVRPSVQPSVLTPRQLEVLKWRLVGYTVPMVADRLCISDATVKYHLATIYHQLGVTSHADALVMAIREGLISDLPDFDV